MTGQVSDVLYYKKTEYSIVGVSGGELPSPYTFGMTTYSATTACWRGFQLAFRVEDSLILDGLWLNTKEPKDINGQKATKSPSFFDYYYEDIGYFWNFTGSITIAKDFLQNMYIHMGFQEAVAFETVLKLTFKEGKLTKVTDLSKFYLEKRENKDYEREPLDPTNKDSTKEWIKERFNLRKKE